MDARLGALVIGRSPGADTLSRDLSEDRGVPLVADMITGVQSVHDYPGAADVYTHAPHGTWHTRGSRFDEGLLEPGSASRIRSSQAEAFAAYLAEQRLDVPYLTKVLEFERANAASLVDGKRRAVHFAISIRACI